MADRSPFTLIAIMPSGSGKLTVAVAPEFGEPLAGRHLRSPLRFEGSAWDSLHEAQQRLVRALMIPTVDGLEFSERTVSVTWGDWRIEYDEMAASLRRSLEVHQVATSVDVVPNAVMEQADWYVIPPDLTSFTRMARAWPTQGGGLVRDHIHMVSDLPDRTAYRQWIDTMFVALAGNAPVRYRVRTADDDKLVLEPMGRDEQDEGETRCIIKAPWFDPAGEKVVAFMSRLAGDPDLLARVMQLVEGE